MDFFHNLTQYHWLVFACVILIFEIFGAGGFMLGFSLAALTVSILIALVAINWHVQLITFALISVIASIAWYVYQNKKDVKDEASTTLNKKENQLVGQKITLEEDLQIGKGRIKFGDTTWPVYTEEELKKGDVVEIDKVNGIFLHIHKMQVK